MITVYRLVGTRYKTLSEGREVSRFIRGSFLITRQPKPYRAARSSADQRKCRIDNERLVLKDRLRVWL